MNIYKVSFSETDEVKLVWGAQRDPALTYYADGSVEVTGSPYSPRIAASDPISAIKIAVKAENKKITAKRNLIANDPSKSLNQATELLTWPKLQTVSAEDVFSVKFVESVEVAE